MYTNILISVGRKPHLIIMKNKKPRNPHMRMWKISVDCSVTSCVMLTEKNSIRYKMYVSFFQKFCLEHASLQQTLKELHLRHTQKCMQIFQYSAIIFIKCYPKL